MKIIKVLLPILILLTACKDNIEDISIQREGSLIFNVDGYEGFWKSNLINVYPGPSILKVFPGNPDESIIFKRNFVVFSGNVPDGGTFELTITLDLADELAMRHNYTTEYTSLNGGLYQISLIIRESDNTTIKLAEMCDNNADLNNFNITRQDLKENLIAGTLDADLCLNGLEDIKYIIYNAEFKDIKYAE